VRLWDADTGKELLAGEGHTDEVAGVAYSPDGKLVATGSGGDGTVRLWDAAAAAPVRVLRLAGRRDHFSRDYGLRGLAFSPDGLLLATAGNWESAAQLWEVSTGRLAHTLSGHEERRHWAEFRPVAFSPDGQFLAAGGKDNAVVLWEVCSGKAVRALTGH